MTHYSRWTPLLALLFVAACPTGRDRPDATPMVAIPGGTFTLGGGTRAADPPTRPRPYPELCELDKGPYQRCDNVDGLAKLSHLPATSVTLDAFEIDQHEVTNLQYQLCVEDGACSEPSRKTLDGEAYYGEDDYKDHPVVWVTREQAEAYCSYRNKRLPSEAQWEAAARGTEGRLFPWGEQTVGCGQVYYRDGSKACERLTRPTTSIDPDAIKVGDMQLRHMASNVAEWVSTRFDELAYCDREAKCDNNDKCVEDCAGKALCQPATSWDPKPTSSAPGMVRGGSYLRTICALRLYSRQAQSEAAEDVGFRCAAATK